MMNQYIDGVCVISNQIMNSDILDLTSGRCSAEFKAQDCDCPLNEYLVKV
jgi:hypothetical protein